MIFLLAACGGQLHTSDGDERVRTALWFDQGATGGVSTVAILSANSTIPCEAQDVPNDPDTPDIDEAASAVEWWQAQLAAAVTREGAWIAVFRYGVDAGALPTGTIDLSPDGWSGDTAEHGGAGWLHIIESQLDEQSGAIYTYEPLEYEVDELAVGDLHAADAGGQLGITFDLGNDLSGSFSAEKCESEALISAAVRALTTYAEGALDIVTPA